MQFYIGSYTREGGAGISLLTLTATGRASVRTVAWAANPSYLALHPAKRVLYAVNERRRGTVCAYSHDAVTGALTRLNSLPTGGASPCHLAVNPGGRWLAVANYRGGSVSLFALDAAGRIGARTALVKHRGSGPNRQRQRRPHAHGVFWRSRTELWVTDLGIDQVLRYRLDPADGTLLSLSPLVAPAGFGPRHLAFHPNGKHAYIVGELRAELLVFSRTRNGWVAGAPQTLLPPNHGSTPSAAAIRLSEDGRRLYASNRGYDSLALFDLTRHPEAPALLARWRAGGAHPRDFALLPDGSVLTCNQRDGTIARADGKAPHVVARVTAACAILAASEERR